VAGAPLRGVSFFLRGRRLGRVTRENTRGRFTFSIDPGSLQPGASYHVLALVGSLPHGTLLLRRLVHVCA
jgi:hypothetical protein